MFLVRTASALLLGALGLLATTAAPVAQVTTANFTGSVGVADLMTSPTPGLGQFSFGYPALGAAFCRNGSNADLHLRIQGCPFDYHTLNHFVLFGIQGGSASSPGTSLFGSTVFLPVATPPVSVLAPPLQLTPLGGWLPAPGSCQNLVTFTPPGVAPSGVIGGPEGQKIVLSIPPTAAGGSFCFQAFVFRPIGNGFMASSNAINVTFS